MPWWSWVMIWVGLVALLIAMLIVLGLRVWRKFTAATGATSRASEIIEKYAPIAAAAVPDYAPRADALHRGGRVVERERRALVELRAERRAERRARKIARANRLLTADPLRYRYLITKRK